MKTITLIRHGESEGNASPVYQNPNSPLSRKGRDQCSRAAERLARATPHTMLISSTLLRAQETADILGKRLGLSPIASDLFVERRKPSNHVGMEKIGAEMRRMSELIHSNFREGWRLSDEENFDDLKARAGQALAYLAGTPEERILVSTHGVFMRCIATHAMFGPAVTGSEMGQVMRSLRTDNTGITIFEYDTSRTNPWHIKSWNDYAHLAGETLIADEDRV